MHFRNSEWSRPFRDHPHFLLHEYLLNQSEFDVELLHTTVRPHVTVLQLLYGQMVARLPPERHLPARFFLCNAFSRDSDVCTLPSIREHLRCLISHVLDQLDAAARSSSSANIIQRFEQLECKMREHITECKTQFTAEIAASQSTVVHALNGVAAALHTMSATRTLPESTPDPVATPERHQGQQTPAITSTSESLADSADRSQSTVTQALGNPQNSSALSSPALQQPPFAFGMHLPQLPPASHAFPLEQQAPTPPVSARSNAANTFDKSIQPFESGDLPAWLAKAEHTFQQQHGLSASAACNIIRSKFHGNMHTRLQTDLAASSAASVSDLIAAITTLFPPNITLAEKKAFSMRQGDSQPAADLAIQLQAVYSNHYCSLPAGASSLLRFVNCFRLSQQTYIFDQIHATDQQWQQGLREEPPSFADLVQFAKQADIRKPVSSYRPISAVTPSRTPAKSPPPLVSSHASPAVNLAIKVNKAPSSLQLGSPAFSPAVQCMEPEALLSTSEGSNIVITTPSQQHLDVYPFVDSEYDDVCFDSRSTDVSRSSSSSPSSSNSTSSSRAFSVPSSSTQSGHVIGQQQPLYKVNHVGVPEVKGHLTPQWCHQRRFKLSSSCPVSIVRHDQLVNDWELIKSQGGQLHKISPIDIKMSQHQSVTAHYLLTDFKIFISKAVYTVNAYVVDAAEHSYVLGMDFMTRFDAQLKLRDQYMSIGIPCDALLPGCKRPKKGYQWVPIDFRGFHQPVHVLHVVNMPPRFPT